MESKKTLEDALADMEANKERMANYKKEFAAEIEAANVKSNAMDARLAALTQEERRKVLNAAGMRNISAAPPPITPVRGTAGVSYRRQATTANAPNWKEWQHTPEVEAWQACALSLGIAPHSMKHSRNGWMAGPGSGPFFEPESFPSNDVKAEFELRQRVLLANLSNRAFFSPGILNMSTPGNHGVRLSEFAAWGLSIGWADMPPALVALALAQPQSALISVGQVAPEPPLLAPESPSFPKHTPKQRLQETAILEWLEDEYGNTKALPKSQQGKSGPKAAAWVALAQNRGLFQSKTVFDKAWERLRASADIQDAN